MFPKIVISSDSIAVTSYIEELLKKNNIPIFNIYKVEPLDTGIGIDQIREVFSHIITQSPQGRMIIIYGVDNATIEAQNALLKILEERTGNNLFVLTGKTIERILPTIRSRAQVVILNKNDNSAAVTERIENIKKLYKKMQIKNSYSFLSDINLPKTREETAVFIDDIIIFFKSLLSKDDGVRIPAVIKKAFEAKNNILSLNCNHQLVIDNLLIFIHKRSTMKER